MFKRIFREVCRLRQEEAPAQPPPSPEVKSATPLETENEKNSLPEHVRTAIEEDLMRNAVMVIVNYEEAKVSLFLEKEAKKLGKKVEVISCQEFSEQQERFYERKDEGLLVIITDIADINDPLFSFGTSSPFMKLRAFTEMHPERRLNVAFISPNPLKGLSHQNVLRNMAHLIR